MARAAVRCRLGDRVVQVAVVGAVAGALTAPGAPAGWAPADAAWRALLAGATVVAAARARRSAWLAGAALVAVAGPPRWVAVACGFAAMAVAVAATRAPHRSRPTGAIVGALVAQGVLRLAWPPLQGGASLVAAAAVGVLGVSGWRQAPRRIRRQASAVGFGVVAAVGLAAAAWAVAFIDARAQFDQAVAAAREGLAATSAGDLDGAATALDRAAEAFGRADAVLSSWWAAPARAVPVVGQHALALAVTSRQGQAVAELAAGAARETASPRLSLADGRIDPAAIAALERPLQASLAATHRAARAIAATRSGWLVAPLQRDLAALVSRLERAHQQGAPLVRAVRALPAMVGADGPRRWFVALQTPSELRGSGGFIGNYAEIEAVGGRLRMTRHGRIGELNPPPGQSYTLTGPPDYLARYDRFGTRRYFQNATFSPDFPSAARVMEQLYPQATGRRVDGVVGVDPVALAAILSVTGPVRVERWPEPIDATNAERILLHDQYLRLAGAEREGFLADVTRVVFDTLVERGVGDWPAVIRALAPAVRGRHLMVHAVVPAEQRALSALGLAGAIAPVRGDYLQVVTQNGGENKIDWYLRRTIDYRVRVDERDGRATARVAITLENRAPAAGEPPIVIGGEGSPYPAGVNRLYLTVYSPLGFDGATIDGRPLPMQSEREAGRFAISQFLSVPPGERVRVVVRLAGRLPAGPYRLDVGRQPTVAPDRLSVSFGRPSGATTRLYDGDLLADLTLTSGR